MLLNVKEIKQKLDDEFLELEPEVIGYRLTNSKMDEHLVQELNSIFSVSLPQEFIDLILNYDFGDLTVGGVWFGNNDNYFKFLLNMNLENQEYPWWGTGEKPENLLLIGATDGYIILLDCKSGYIEAYLRSSTWQNAGKTSENFNLFFRGIGTAYLEKEELKENQELQKNLIEEVKPKKDVSFWSELINGIA